LPISFLWLLIEVGLVEEFFFRAFIQSRLAAFFRSEVTGIVLSCLIFGLAHAPGLVLRGAGIISPVGESPSILLGVGYSIVILSVTGFGLGIVWARTRNLLVLMVIHAAGDLLPNFGELVEAFHI
jgi:membrane protease YdiL (CAAX protease family)